MYCSGTRIWNSREEYQAVVDALAADLARLADAEVRAGRAERHVQPDGRVLYRFLDDGDAPTQCARAKE